MNLYFTLLGVLSIGVALRFAYMHFIKKDDIQDNLAESLACVVASALFCGIVAVCVYVPYVLWAVGVVLGIYSKKVVEWVNKKLV